MVQSRDYSNVMRVGQSCNSDRQLSLEHPLSRSLHRTLGQGTFTGQNLASIKKYITFNSGHESDIYLSHADKSGNKDLNCDNKGEIESE